MKTTDNTTLALMAGLGWVLFLLAAVGWGLALQQISRLTDKALAAILEEEPTPALLSVSDFDRHVDAALEQSIGRHPAGKFPRRVQ